MWQWKLLLTFLFILQAFANFLKFNQGCPVDVHGGYTEWSVFSNCTRTCGEGLQHRNRSCCNPAPQGGGKDCCELGSATHTRVCNAMLCTCPETHMYPYAPGSYCCKTNKGIIDAATQRDKCACCQGDCSAKRLCTYNVEADFALNKPALQSSTFERGDCATQRDCRASSANDGSDATFCVTKHDKNAWWSVDMQMQVIVRKIVIKVTQWALSIAYNDLKIDTRQTEEEQWKLCRQTSGIPTSADVTVVCDQKTTARYVRVTNGKKEVLRLIAVNVHGTV